MTAMVVILTNLMTDCAAGELAEGMGFEPTIRITPYNGLANRRLQPLGHPSTDEWGQHGVCAAGCKE